MEPEIYKAVAALRVVPETAGLAADLDAEYERARAHATRVGLAMLAGLIVVGTLAGLFLAMINDPDLIGDVLGHASDAIPVAAIPALIVLAIIAKVFALARRLYARYRACVFLDAQSSLGPQVSVARQEIETGPAEVLFNSVHMVVTLALLLTGFAWAAVIWIGTSAALRVASSPKSM